VVEIALVTTSPPIPLRPDLLDPTLDVVFKLLMTREPRLLRHMLEGILRRPIRSLRLVDTDSPAEHARGKAVVFDVRCVLDDGTRIALEMQRRPTVALRSRLLFYWARGFTDQLSRGDDYDQLKPTVVIAWLLQPLFPSLEELHTVFEVNERHHRASFGEELAIHLLQLGESQRRALSASQASGYDAVIERWARFITRYDDPSELERLAKEDPMMALAKQTLEELSQDPEARRRAQRREDELRLYELEQRASRKQAREEGWAEGKAALLLRLLAKRFGPLPPTAVARVQAATSDELDGWAERVLTEPTLDDVLAS
jgi:predicted transposase/invertase (TIGR01784 family)